MQAESAVIPQPRNDEIKNNIPEALAKMAKPEMPDVKALLRQLTAEISATTAKLRVLKPDLVKQELNPEVQAKMRQGLESIAAGANDRRASRIQGVQDKMSAIRTRAGEICQPIVNRAQEVGRAIGGHSEKLVAHFRGGKDNLAKSVESRGFDAAATLFKSLSSAEDALGNKIGSKALREAATGNIMKAVGLRARAEIMRTPMKPMPPLKL